MIALVLASALALSAAAPPPTPPLTLDQKAYSAELARLEGEVDSLRTTPQNAEALRKSLPEAWDVSEAGAGVSVNTGFLREALADFQKASPDRKKVMLDQLRQRLAVMRQESERFARASQGNAEARRRLDAILAAREFSAVHPPSALETLWDRIVATIERWFERASDKLPDLPGLGRIFVWCAIAIVTCALAIWLYRFSTKRGPDLSREVIPFAPSSKNWRLWLAEADAEAARGNWRNAIHLAYWAAISYLESSGLWQPDRARTPREYVRSISRSNPLLPLFSAFTRRFEAIWYGDKPAAAADFEQARAELEQLGCR